MSKYQIYIITNTINEKQYVGLTRRGVQKRWYDYKIKSTVRIPHGAIQRAIRKYGIDNFKFDVLYNLLEEDNDYLKAMEKHFVVEYNTFNSGYNMDEGGTDGVVFHTEETKKRISKKVSGKNNPMYGTDRSNNKGWKWSEEAKQRYSESLMGLRSGDKHPNWGKQRSKETRKKISESNKGQKAWNKGVPMSDSAKKKLSESRKGQKNGIKSYIITKPDGNVEEINNLKEYCKENKLNYPSMCQLSTGKVDKYKNYKVKKIKEKI